MTLRKAMVAFAALAQASTAQAQTAPLRSDQTVSATVFGIGGMKCGFLVSTNSLSDKSQSTYWHAFGFISGVFTSQSFFSKEVGAMATHSRYQADEALDKYWDDTAIDKVMNRVSSLCAAYPDSSLNAVANLLIEEIVDQHRKSR